MPLCCCCVVLWFLWVEDFSGGFKSCYVVWLFFLFWRGVFVFCCCFGYLIWVVVFWLNFGALKWVLFLWGGVAGFWFGIRIGVLVYSDVVLLCGDKDGLWLCWGGFGLWDW